MSRARKTLDRILKGASDSNIRFADMRVLLRDLGFSERIRGSHHIFSREGVEEILNLQPKGAKAKAYQVRQVRAVILAYGLGGDSSDEETAIEPESGEE
jgi:hypothetical protein